MDIYIYIGLSVPGDHDAGMFSLYGCMKVTNRINKLTLTYLKSLSLLFN